MKTLNETEVTPRPWRAVLGGGYPFLSEIRATQSSADGLVQIATVSHSASYSAEANAEHIVRCVNSHEALLRQRNKLLGACQQLLKFHQPSEHSLSYVEAYRAEAFAKTAIAVTLDAIEAEWRSV